MSRRFWTDDERAMLVRLYPDHTAAECARILGRTIRFIYLRVELDGLVKQSRVTVDAAFEAELRRLSAEGWPDREIAASLGCDAHTIHDRRRALGLPSNAFSPRVRARIAANTRRQCERLGISSLTQLRTYTWRQYARERGWPDDLRWRAVQILDVLDQHGPMTRREIAAAIGMPWKGSRKSLVSNGRGGTYLASLIRRGLVVSLGRCVQAGGRSQNVHLYSLSLLAQRSATDAVEAAVSTA